MRGVRALRRDQHQIPAATHCVHDDEVVAKQIGKYGRVNREQGVEETRRQSRARQRVSQPGMRFPHTA